MSPGLMRAREPYKVKNALTGVALSAFAVGAWIYAMNAVKQDTFEDVDEEAKAMVRTGVKSLEDEERERLAARASGTVAAPPELELAAPAATTFVSASKSAPAPTPAPVSVSTPAKTRGVLAGLAERRMPELLDRRGKTFVWGAPPVDRFGRLGDRPSS